MKKGIVIGLVSGLTIAGASLSFANSQIQAILNNQIKVTLNGVTQTFRDETTNEIQYPITYKDRTYLPLRTVADLVGVDVDYDAETKTAILNSNSMVLDGSEESIKAQLIAAKQWLPQYIVTERGEDVGLKEYYGSGIDISNSGLIFKEDNTFTCFIGIYGDNVDDYTGKYDIDIEHKRISLEYDSGKTGYIEYLLTESNIILDIVEDNYMSGKGAIRIGYEPRQKEENNNSNNDDKLLSNFDFSDTLTDSFQQTKISINEKGTELVFEYYDYFNGNVKNKIKLTGFSGKVKSMKYCMSEQLLYAGTLIILSEDGKIYLNNSTSISDEEIPKQWALKEIKTPYKVESIAPAGGVNSYFTIILKYANGEYMHMDSYGNIIESFTKLKMMDVLHYGAGSDFPETVFEGCVGVVNLNDNLYKLSFEKKNYDYFVLKAYGTDNKESQLVEWLNFEDFGRTELSILKDEYLVITQVSPYNSGISSNIKIFDKDLKEVTSQEIFFSESENKFDYEISNDKLVFTAYELFNPSQVGTNHMTKLHRVYYEVVEKNGTLKINRVKEDVNDIKYTAAT